MSKQVMEMALEALEYHTEQTRPIAKTEKAIVALKEAIKNQGEPVGQFFDDGNLGGARWLLHSGKPLKHGDFLYASAPTIPAGWQLVPKEPTGKMLSAGYDCAKDGTYLMHGIIWDAMLSAAPKGADQ